MKKAQVGLNYGREISEASPAEVTRDPKVIEVYLGEDFSLQSPE